MLSLRNATEADLGEIRRIYEYAQDYMIRSGNPTQWGRSYPSADLIRSDLQKKVCKVIYDETGIHGVFALFDGAEPTYAHIEEGEWLNDEPYVTIHRPATGGSTGCSNAPPSIASFFPQCPRRYPRQQYDDAAADREKRL